MLGDSHRMRKSLSNLFWKKNGIGHSWTSDFVSCGSFRAFWDIFLAMDWNLFLFNNTDVENKMV